MNLNRPSDQTPASIRRGTLLTLAVPLCVFALLLLVTLHRSMEHSLLLRDFHRVVQFIPLTEPLRVALNRELDRLTLHQDATPAPQPDSETSTLAFESAVRSTAELQQTVQMGRYRHLLEDVAQVALQAESLHRRARRELDADGRVSNQTLARLEETLQALYFVRLRATNSFRISLDAIENTKAVLLETAAIDLRQSHLRRIISRFLQEAGMDRETALLALDQINAIRSHHRRVREILPGVDWEPLRRHIQEVQVQVENYQDEPLLRLLLEEVIPAALRGGLARPSVRMPVPDVNNWYTLDQQYRIEYERSAQRLMREIELVARGNFLRDVLVDGTLLLLLLLSITFSFMRFRHFLRRTVSRMTGLRDELHEISDSGNFSARLPEHGQDELAQISRSINELLGAVGTRETQIEALLKKSETDNQRLSRQGEEINNRNAALRSATEELKRVNQELEERSRRLEQADQIKNEFLTNMSHELRTPLNSILLLSEVLKQNRNGHLDRDEVESASVMYEAGKSLLSLVNDILDFSRLQSGEIQLKPEPLHVHYFIESIQSRFRPLAGHKGLKFRVHVDPDLPEVIQVDAVRLQQIISNLLTNAVKFSRQGSITLEVARSHEQDSNSLLFNVRDTGKGIASNDLSRVFDAFEQADGTSTRAVGGIGLGLSLASKIARLMGGSLHAQSAEGIGSTFTLQIPVGEPAQADRDANAGQRNITPPPSNPALVPADVTQVQFEGQTVLLVDDDMRAVFSLARALKDLNLYPLKASRTDRAMEILRERGDEVRAVCISIQTEDNQGVQAIEKIRGLDAMDGLPIIALTERVDATITQQCLAAGADRHLAKPFALEELAHVLRELFRNRSRLRACS